MEDALRASDSPTTHDSPAKAQVIEKVVAAARRLFAERGPAAVPLREIAHEAGVNYGLIHHYIGSKDDLIRLVFMKASTEYADEFGRAESAQDAIAFLMHPRNSEFVRMLARSLLENRDPATLIERSPAMLELSRLIGEDMSESMRASDQDPRVIAAMLTTLGLGWGLFGDFVRTITGLSHLSSTEVKDSLYAVALAGVGLR